MVDIPIRVSEVEVASITQRIESANVQSDEDLAKLLEDYKERAVFYVSNNRFLSAMKDYRDAIKAADDAAPEFRESRHVKNLIGVMHKNLGRLSEELTDLAEAAKHYQIAAQYIPQFVPPITELLQSAGYPRIASADAFPEVAMIHRNISKEVILEPLRSLTNKIDVKDENKGNVTSLQLSEIGLLVDIIYALHYENSEIFQAALDLGEKLAALGIENLWKRIDFLYQPLCKGVEYKRILHLLTMAPPKAMEELADAGFIEPVAKLANADNDDVFYLLYHFAFNSNNICEIASTVPMDILFSAPSKGHIFLLIHLLSIPQFCHDALEHNVYQFMLEALPEFPAAVFSSLTRLFINSPVSSYVDTVFEQGVPIIFQNSRTAEIAKSGFGCLATAIHVKVPSNNLDKAIKGCSAIMALHIKDAGLAQHAIAFLYECAEAGLESHLVAIPAICQTAKKVFQAYITNKEASERAFAVLSLVHDPELIALATQFATSHPAGSEIVSKYLTKATTH